MSGGGAQQGQAGGMQQPLGGGMGQAAQGGFGSSALTFGNIAPPVGATNPQNVSNNLQQFQSSLMGSPMQGGMQQQLPPQMQGGMAGLLQGGGVFGGAMNPENTTFTKNYGMGSGMQQPLAAMGGGFGLPMQAPNGNFGMQSPMVGMPMGLTQQQIDKIRQQMQNGMMQPGDTFIPQGNSQGQSFGNMLSGLSPEFRAGLLGDGMRAQVQPPAGGPAREAFFAELARNQGGMPRPQILSGTPLPNPQYVDPNTGRYTGLGSPIGLQPNPQIPFNQWVQSQNQDPNVPAMTTQQLQNKYMQEMGGMRAQVQPPQIQQPEFYTNYLQGLQNSGQSLMGNINAGQPGIPSTQGGLGSLGPMRSTPMPAAPTPPTQTAPTRPQPARAVQTINRAEQQAKIQGAQDQMNRMRSMGVGGARDYLSQLMGRR